MPMSGSPGAGSGPILCVNAPDEGARGCDDHPRQGFIRESGLHVRVDGHFNAVRLHTEARMPVKPRAPS